MAGSSDLSPAIPGFILCFIATVLLVFVCVSVPTWDAISFLNVDAAGFSLRFGVFGFTGSDISVGYDFDALPSIIRDRLDTSEIHNLTKGFVLHPIAAGLSGLVVLSGLCGASFHRKGTVYMALLTALAGTITLITFIIDLVFVCVARNRFRDENSSARFGNALWLTVAAFAILYGSTFAYLRHAVERLRGYY